MGDDTSSQIDQMKSFILNEAHEKAAEINQQAEEQANIEKFKLVEQGKDKVRATYVRKNKELETKVAIAKSTAINKSRLEKIKKRQEALGRIHESALEALKPKSSDKAFIQKLVVQGLLMLLEDDVLVRCRAKDDAVVESCLGEAAKEYANVIQNQTGAKKAVKLSLEKDSSKKLPADGLGGIVLSAQKDTITIDNTLEARLDLVMEQAKPKIRSLLFHK
jgi:V-type H+-transporting ATPase subunit E